MHWTNGLWWVQASKVSNVSIMFICNVFILRQKMEAGIPPTSAYNRGDKHNKNKQNRE